MRTARLLVVGFAVLALGLAAGCAKKQLTRSESDRLDAIAAKIAEAERIGAPDCIPYKEIAQAKVELEHARHEMLEYSGKDPSYYENDVRAAEKAADAALAKARECQERKKAAVPAPPPPPAPVVAPPPPPPAPVVEEALFKNIHFDFDKSFIREDAKPGLQAVADYMKAHPDAKVRIEGHCDERGTAEYNMALGERRATSAKKYLVGLGIDASRLSTISYGKERPLCTEHNEECWQRNRRAVFDLLK
ncbi:MAG: peptidoglycan-associated lipoprotein Pal [Verrucomicrobiota bacterium]